MIDHCRSHIHYFLDEHVCEKSDSIQITESADKGKGTAEFRSASPAIVFVTHSKKPLTWMRDTRCADGAFLTFDAQGAHLHIAELKSKLTPGKWAAALKQFEGMFLSASAAARLLDVKEFISVTCYIAYSADALNPALNTSPTLLKAPVGAVNQIGGAAAWQKEEVSLPFQTSAKLRKAQRNAEGNADFGAVH